MNSIGHNAQQVWLLARKEKFASYGLLVIIFSLILCFLYNVVHFSFDGNSSAPSGPIRLVTGYYHVIISFVLALSYLQIQNSFRKNGLIKRLMYDGWSRSRIATYFIKNICILVVAATFLTVIVFYLIFGLFLSLLTTGPTFQVFSHDVLNFLLTLFAYVTFAASLHFIFRGHDLSVIFFILCCILLPIAGLLDDNFYQYGYRKMLPLMISSNINDLSVYNHGWSLVFPAVVYTIIKRMPIR